MKIKSLRLKHFKRFTDLTLQEIPEIANLVMLIGSNGSGKSSVFDAFEVLNKYRIDKTHREDKYYNKEERYQIIADFGNGYHWDTRRAMYKSDEEIKVFHVPLYGRTSFRQIPRLQRTQLGQTFDIRSDNDRPFSFIDRDERFENDLEHLFGRLLREFFRKEDISQIKESVVKPINDAFDRIFNKENGTKLELLELIPPLEGKVAEINFRKGNSVFHYNLLSAGEKEVFNILINLIARRELYQGGILFFDEIDLHLNTKLQFNFLKEVVEHWVASANAQLWTASHSLGFIEYAKQSEGAVIFDFDDYDFDYPRVLVPEPKDNPDIYQIAVDKEILSNLFQGLRIVFVENTDKDIYGSIGIDKTVFVPENGRNGVYHKAKGGSYQGIVDRDFLSDEDIELIERNYTTLKILRYYSIENYMFHPDNLQEYYSNSAKAFSREDYIRELTTEKNAVKDRLIPSLSLKRTEYPYFSEPEFGGKSFQNRFKNRQENIDESAKVASYLNSDDLETFYKVFPMKTNATQINYRKNLSKTELIKMKWFKSQIEGLIL